MRPTTDHRASAWRSLDTGEGRALLREIPQVPGVSDIARLRDRWPADMVHAALDLHAARRRAAGKFGPASRAATLWSDDEGVQMASSPHAARYKAERFRSLLGDAAGIVDLCCGIGGDLMGMTESGLDALGVDADPCRAWMASKNTGCGTLAADALDARVPDHPFHLDPGRRTDAGRTHDTDAYAPSPDVWDAVIDKHGTGCIKLNPGVRPSDLPSGGLEILSERGRLTQALVWTGSLATASRRATRLDDRGAASIEGEPERTDEAHPIDDWIATVDPSVERADLIPALLRDSGAAPVHPGTGLVTSDRPIDHPMLTWFRVLDAFRYDERTAKAALASHGAGVVEVKTRDKLVDPDSVQRRLRGSGGETLTLFVLRFGRERRGIVARRSTAEPCDETESGDKTPPTTRLDTGVLPC